MKKSTSLVVAAMAMVLSAACSGDMPSSPEISRQAALTYYCDPKIDTNCGFTYNMATPSDTIPANEVRNQIVLGEYGVMALIVDATRVKIGPGTQFLVAGITSDTIPGPVPPGPVRAAYEKLGGRTFAAILGSYGATKLVPSDTIPGPGPIGNVKIGNYDADPGLEVAVWMNIKTLSDMKLISANTTGLQLIVKNGNSYTPSAVMPVRIVGPDKVVTHL